jgi:FMN phosphatase YigB (HAD superfamily)
MIYKNIVFDIGGVLLDFSETLADGHIPGRIERCATATIRTVAIWRRALA